MAEITEANWIQTYSGVEFCLWNPSPDMVRLEDIAQGLSNQCRFAGQTRWFYSVAQHSVLVADHMHSRKLQLVGLLHDAAEAYIGDIVRPLKRLLGQRIKEIESNVTDAIAEWAGVDPSLFDNPNIKTADNQALMTERRDLFAHKLDWIEQAEPFPEMIRRMTPEHAYLEFVNRFEELS